MKQLIVLLIVLLASNPLAAQGPVFHQRDLYGYPYEDLSDLLRRSPGLYPLDYGLFNAPVMIRPWEQNPWQLRVELDGIPQNRRYDGIFDSNLQPAAELDSISYHFLGSGSAGTVRLASRSLPVDSPITEFQIREGFYGFTTVDFAHAQRAYHSMTFELTGRLSWYNGMRNDSSYSNTGRIEHIIKTDAHSNRLRGKVGLDVSSRWRAELTYAGSNVQSGNILNYLGEYIERSEGILSFAQKDSLRSAWNPRLQLYLRQDRENWGNPFHARELTGGYVATAALPALHQRLSLRQTGSLSQVYFPGMNRQRLMTADLTLADSIRVGFGGLRLSGSLAHESSHGAGVNDASIVLPSAEADLTTTAWRGVSARAGLQYVEETVPVAWRYGRYDVVRRPLLIAPEFADTVNSYGAATAPLSMHADRYLKGRLGAGWSTAGGTSVDLDAIVLQRQGNFANAFLVQNRTISMSYAPVQSKSAVLGIAGSAIIPLWYGLRLDNWWSAQAASDSPSDILDSRGYTRLYFEHAYFKSPLIIRSHLSYEYFGERVAYSDLGTYTMRASGVVGFRVSGTIKGVTLIWGTENLLNSAYEVLPGYKMTGKEEYLQFIWTIWL
jgi:hypothetical protein